MLRIIPASEYREAVWKNGGGVSYEIAGVDGWRVSIAVIDRDGPFSDYRGYDRTIVALDGDPVELEIRGERVQLSPLEPFDFAGEEAVYARVRGRARDLNVMTAREEYAHDVAIVPGRERFVLDEDETALVYAIDGRVCVDDAEIAPGDTLVVWDAEAFTVTADGAAAVVRLTER